MATKDTKVELVKNEEPRGVDPPPPAPTVSGFGEGQTAGTRLSGGQPGKHAESDKDNGWA